MFLVPAQQDGKTTSQKMVISYLCYTFIWTTRCVRGWWVPYIFTRFLCIFLRSANADFKILGKWFHFWVPSGCKWRRLPRKKQVFSTEHEKIEGWLERRDCHSKLLPFILCASGEFPFIHMLAVIFSIRLRICNWGRIGTDHSNYFQRFEFGRSSFTIWTNGSLSFPNMTHNVEGISLTSMFLRAHQSIRQPRTLTKQPKHMHWKDLFVSLSQGNHSWIIRFMGLRQDVQKTVPNHQFRRDYNHLWEMQCLVPVESQVGTIDVNCQNKQGRSEAIRNDIHWIGNAQGRTVVHFNHKRGNIIRANTQISLADLRSS